MFPPGEDSSSDLSSDSPVWSEDESDAELDLNMPLSEQGVETVSHGSEIVRCICEVQEENDFMIQVNYHPLKLYQTSLWLSSFFKNFFHISPTVINKINNKDITHYIEKVVRYFIYLFCIYTPRLKVPL